jgi:hypothetical protein
MSAKGRSARRRSSARPADNIRYVSPDEFIENFEERLVAAGLSKSVVTVDLSAGRSSVSFDLIRVEATERGKGLAGRVVLLLTQVSDEGAMPITVIPRSLEDGGLGDAALDAWYLRHGFVRAPTQDTPRLMRREPRSL